jgi:integrase
MESDKHAGRLVRRSKRSFKQVADGWLAHHARIKASERTYYNYVSMLKVHVRPVLDAKYLDTIKKTDIRGLYSSFSAKGLSPVTVRHIHTVLKAILQWAIAEGDLRENPCDGVTLPRVEDKEILYLNQEEAQCFLDAAKSDKFSTLFHLAIVTGCRPEEYLALRWRDVNWQTGQISINRALIKKRGGGFAIEKTKTKHSRRSIPLTADLLEDLKAHRRLQLELRMAMGAFYLDNDLVFATRFGSPIDMSNLSRRHLVPIRDKASVPKITLYGLRHTCATLMLIGGVNVKVVSERLGHSSVVITLNTYSHVIETLQESATETMGDLLRKRA